MSSDDGQSTSLAADTAPATRIVLVESSRDPARYMYVLEAELDAYEQVMSREMTWLAIFTGLGGAFASWVVSFALGGVPATVLAASVAFGLGGALGITTLISGIMWNLERRKRPTLRDTITSGRK